MRRIFYNNWLAKLLLWSGYSTAMIFGYICTKGKKQLSLRIKQHESIHAEQYNEITMISFIIAIIFQLVFGGKWLFVCIPIMYYIIYIIEALITWLVRVWKNGWKDALDIAYNNSMFEQEARYGESVYGYIETRKYLSFLRYFGKI